MATKLTRQTLYQFGSTVNGTSEVGEYGSGATGSPVYTGSITLMQSLAAWGRGWAAETIANNRPFLEDMNAVDCVFGYQLSYVMQMGVPEYDTTGNTYYFLNSIAQYGGVLYQVINDNGGIGISATLPTNQTYWQLLVAVSRPVSATVAGASSFTLSGLLPNTRYKLLVNLKQNTSNGTVGLQFNGDSGSNYQYTGLFSSRSTTSNGGAGSQTSVPLTPNTDTLTAGGYLEAEILLQTTIGNNNNVLVSVISNYLSSEGYYIPAQVGGLYAGSGALSSVTILTSAGTITGNAQIYQLN